MSRISFAIVIACAFGAACDDAASSDLDGAPAAQRVSMDYAASNFYAAPFPGEHLRTAEGTIDLSRAPNPLRAPIVDQIHRALDEVDGFATSASIHFHLDGEIDSRLLPDAFSSTADLSPILLIDVDPDSPEYGERKPFTAYFQSDAGPYGDTFFLTLVPIQGIPLRPSTLYAAVITDSLRSADGAKLERANAMNELIDGRTPPGMNADAHIAFATAMDSLASISIDLDRIVAMTTFRTGDPLAILRRAIDTSEGRYAATLTAPFTAQEVTDSYCVFEGRIRMPVFQGGTPPYSEEGGGWVFDSNHMLVLQREEDARIWITVPRLPMPERGFPGVLMIRTGAGGERPLVDRGVHDASGVALPGTGPALEFAAIGFAGISIEGPHGGSRNITGTDEQFLIFNIQNPTALRDNLRQSALELVLLARTLDTMMFDASSCPGLMTSAGDGIVRFDTSHLALMGHSMGASIAPLAAAFESRFGAIVLSGAGASWIENVLYKERPLVTRPIAETLLRYSGRRSLTPDDPVLGLLQWAGEAADAQIYSPLLIDESESRSRHVLMFQGVVDHYIPPPVANALSLAISIDIAGPSLDEMTSFTPIAELLPLRNRRPIDLPAMGNRQTRAGPSVTAVVVQHEEDGIEDGHEIVFQREEPKSQYRCFLRTFADDEIPIVPEPNSVPAACTD